MTRWLGLCLVLSSLVPRSPATAQQLPLITSFSQNGQLVCSNLPPHGIGVVEWAPTPSGPWTNTWANLAAVVADTNGALHATVPMFYRVRTSPPPTNGMVLIPAGSFTIGLSAGDTDIADAIPTNVYVSSFYMDVNLVTLGQWQAVASAATNSLGYSFIGSGSAPGTNYPVTTISWWDCFKWCNARSQLAGLTPVYYTDPGFTHIFTNGTMAGLSPDNRPYVNWNANGYRLPTEAEWEKAARGGPTGQRFPWGNTISQSFANYTGNTGISYDLGPDGPNPLGFGGNGTTPAGTFPLNGYGLTDMAGNTWQWCYDTYAGPPYPAGSPYLGGTDPRGPATSGTPVARGGPFGATADVVRCAARSALGTTPTANKGFRCVRTP